MALSFARLAGGLLPCVALACSPTTIARDNPPPPLRELPPDVVAMDRVIVEQKAAWNTVRSLTTEVGPRLSGSPGDALAIAWAVKTMRSLGLQHVHAEPVTVPVFKRGVEIAEITGPVARPLSISTLGWSGATPRGGITAEVVRFSSLDELRAAPPEIVRGKIAFLDVPMDRTIDGTGYDKVVPVRYAGADAAQAKRAAALVIRSVGTDHNRSPHTGVMRDLQPGDNPNEREPAGALGNADADLLARVLETFGHVQLHIDLEPSRAGTAESANVVGEVPGSVHPEEVVLLGAHLDSWDLGEGAVDDGAGCAIVLAAASSIASLQVHPGRTVRVVLFAAEETSGDGAHAYAAAHAADAAHIVVAAEADSGGDRALLVQGLMAEEGMRELHSVDGLLAPLGVRVADEKGKPGMDVRSLARLGVPIVEIEQDFTHYFDVHHTADDTLAQVDPDALAQVARAFARVAWRLANSNKSFGRIAYP